MHRKARPNTRVSHMAAIAGAVVAHEGPNMKVPPEEEKVYDATENDLDVVMVRLMAKCRTALMKLLYYYETIICLYMPMSHLLVESNVSKYPHLILNQHLYSCL